MSTLHTVLNRLPQFGLTLILVTSISGCATPTVGQQFRDIMADIDADCKKKGLGPYLDRSKPQPLEKITDTSCEILRIKPADPLATEEGRIAYSIKLPAPHGELQTQYSKGMSAESYFKQLCEKDAGEWVFKTVEGVEGVFQGRRNYQPREGAPLVYRMYEATEMQTRNMENLLVQPYHGRFNFMERPRDSDETGLPYVRFFRGAEVPGHYKYGTQKNGMPTHVPYIVNREQTDILKSRYGFTWRQIADRDMLENGVTGSETIIYDRMTNEVLAFRRFFGRVWPRRDSRYTRLVYGDYCQPGFTDGTPKFVQKVLVPINPAE